jgi:hypothetical protein
MRTFGDEHAARRSTAIAHPGAYIAKVQPPLAKYNPGRYVDGWAHNPYWGT